MNFGGLPSDDASAGAALIDEYAAVGVTRFVLGGRYANRDGFLRMVDQLVAIRELRS